MKIRLWRWNLYLSAPALYVVRSVWPAYQESRRGALRAAQITESMAIRFADWKREDAALVAEDPALQLILNTNALAIFDRMSTYQVQRLRERGAMLKMQAEPGLRADASTAALLDEMEQLGRLMAGVMEAIEQMYALLGIWQALLVEVKPKVRELFQPTSPGPKAGSAVCQEEVLQMLVELRQAQAGGMSSTQFAKSRNISKSGMYRRFERFGIMLERVD